MVVETEFNGLALHALGQAVVNIARVLDHRKRQMRTDTEGLEAEARREKCHSQLDNDLYDRVCVE